MIDKKTLSEHPERYLQVCDRVCDECLFSKHRVVGSPRMKELIAGAIAADAHFICHKHSLRADLSEGAVTWQQANVCCRAYYDQIGPRVLVIRLALMLGIVVFVNAAGDPVAEEENRYAIARSTNK